MRRLQWRGAAFAIQAASTRDGAGAKEYNKLYGYETNVQACFRLRNEGGSMPQTARHVHRLLETRSHSVWRTCFTFFETVEDGRVRSCLKKDRALPEKTKTPRLP